MRRLAREAGPPALFVTALVLAWELWARRSQSRNPVLPAPSKIWRAFLDTAHLLPDHLAATLTATALGVGVGVVAGVLSAVIVSSWPLARRVLQPLLVVSQTVPVQVLAPLLVLWAGFGLAPKIIVVALVVFFPVAVSTAGGLQGVDPELVELVRSFGAGRAVLLRMVMIPAALPGLFSGLRISLTYAVAGAVIGETIGAQRGLGLYLSRSQRAFRYDQVFVGVIVIALLSVALFSLVSVLAHVFCPWQRRSDRST
ncbi:MAG: ABC transporter permease [Acidimicrobiales bacterium]|nr:ABC transporter permease [Acidimicrobiales bacterium]